MVQVSISKFVMYLILIIKVEIVSNFTIKIVLIISNFIKTCRLKQTHFYVPSYFRHSSLNNLILLPYLSSQLKSFCSLQNTFICVYYFRSVYLNSNMNHFKININSSYHLLHACFHYKINLKIKINFEN